MIKLNDYIHNTYNNYQYLIRFNVIGYLCGYILIPEYIITENNWKDYDDINILECHGALTYLNDNDISVNEIIIVKKYKGTWIGFDCAHYGDAPHPDYIKENPTSIPLLSMEAEFKDEEYVLNEIKSIITQLEEMGYTKLNNKQIKQNFNILNLL